MLLLLQLLQLAQRTEKCARITTHVGEGGGGDHVRQNVLRFYVLFEVVRCQP